MIFDHALALCSLLLSPPISLTTAELYSRQSAYEESEAILAGVNTRLLNRDRYLFWRALNNFRLNNQKSFEKYVGELEESFTADALPERYKVLVALMKAEAKTWEKSDLGDIARDMRRSTERLQLADGGERVRELQDDIVKRLDRLIKEKEDQAKGGGGDGDGEGKAEGSQNGKGGSSPAKPADDSQIAGGGGKGIVDPARVRKLSEAWGRLPPRERERALQELTQNLSARHREAVSNYFRNISQGKK